MTKLCRKPIETIFCRKFGKIFVVFLCRIVDLEYFSGVELQINDMKQRLSYADELTREHQISAENFRKNIEIQQNELEEFRRRLSNELSRLTLNDVDEIAVS